MQHNWAYRKKTKGLGGPHLTKKSCVKWLEGKLSIQLQGPTCQVNYNIYPKALCGEQIGLILLLFPEEKKKNNKPPNPKALKIETKLKAVALSSKEN